ncbi:hypothetical protein DW177_04525 [Blautia sp. AM16-16B]|uniref:Uncharacterized protein n=1 Tax=Blautia faecicola TaxID=2509240 RepID=A0A4Q1RJ59_9FIRM|nr:hypothetical protein DW177_04525 [Blautia sp. AM16-16B]RXS75787.1 hypothetical protein ETP43_11615 [Blautia faecicola]
MKIIINSVRAGLQLKLICSARMRTDSTRKYISIGFPESRACLKNHFRNLQAPLCGRFYPHSVAVARYAALIRIKSPTN